VTNAEIRMAIGNQSSTDQLDAIKAAAIAQASKDDLDAEKKRQSMNPYAAQESTSNVTFTTMMHTCKKCNDMNCCLMLQTKY
jgi:hypothetical protein